MLEYQDAKKTETVSLHMPAGDGLPTASSMTDQALKDRVELSMSPTACRLA